MAAPTFETFTPRVSSTASVAVPWPSGHAADDIGVLVIATHNTESPGFTDQAGFIELTGGSQQAAGGTAANSLRLSVYLQRATSGAMADVLLSGAGDHHTATILLIRGCPTSGTAEDALNVFVGATDTSEDTSFSYPSVTTTVDDCLIVHIGAHPIDGIGGAAFFSGETNAGLSSLTEQVDFSSSTGSGDGISVVTGIKATAGATGTTAMTLASAAVVAMFTLAFAPPTSGSTGTVAATSPPATAAAAGTPTITGAATVTGPAATVEAADGLTGASASVAPAATASAAGTPVVSGASASTAPAATATIAGFAWPAEEDWTTRSAILEMYGDVGFVTATAGTATASASGTPVVSGASAATAPTATVEANDSQDATGTVQAAAPAATVAASGSPTITGSSAATAPAATTAASGTPTITGTAAAVAPAATASASSETTTVEGEAAVAAPTPTTAASGSPVVAGSSSVAAATPTVEASGSPTVTGSVAAVAPAPLVSASPATVPDVLVVGSITRVEAITVGAITKAGLS